MFAQNSICVQAVRFIKNRTIESISLLIVLILKHRPSVKSSFRKIRYKHTKCAALYESLHSPTPTVSKKPHLVQSISPPWSDPSSDIMIRQDFVYTHDLGFGFVVSLVVISLCTALLLVIPSIRRVGTYWYTVIIFIYCSAYLKHYLLPQKVQFSLKVIYCTGSTVVLVLSLYWCEWLAGTVICYEHFTGKIRILWL